MGIEPCAKLKSLVEVSLQGFSWADGNVVDTSKSTWKMDER